MLMQLTTAVCYIETMAYSMLQKQYNYQNNCNTLITMLGVYPTCYGIFPPKRRIDFYTELRQLELQILYILMLRI